jgi:hypothetical protein
VTKRESSRDLGVDASEPFVGGKTFASPAERHPPRHLGGTIPKLFEAVQLSDRWFELCEQGDDRVPQSV